jgi:putative transposase
MIRTYKYRIYPNKEQEKHFVQAMGCVRYIYNKGFEAKIEHYAKTGKTLSYFDMAGPTGMLIKEKREHEWLNEPYSQSLQMALRNLDNAFQRFFKKKSGFPKFKNKHDGNQSLSYTQWVKVSFQSGKVKIPKAGEMRCVFDREFVGKIKTCTVSKTPTGKFFISILVENDLPLPKKPDINPDRSVGIDLGLKDFAILSNGDKVANPKFLRKKLDRLKILQRRSSKKKKGSNNQRKANRKVAKLHETISNQRTDFLQKLSTKIISENQTIFLEDLNIAGMLRNHKLADAINDVSWYSFVRMLEYKAEWYGNNVVKIGRFEPSSKLCSACGYKNNDLTLKTREWCCPNCNTFHDRDINAAINIKNFGLIVAHARSERPEELVETLTSTTSDCESSSKLGRRSKKQSSSRLK